MADQYPPIPKALLEDLERRFAPTYPDPTKDDERQLWAKAGEGRVVSFLRAKFEEQNETRTRRNP